MPIQLEQIPGESILIATTREPFDPENDVPAMFAEFIRARQTINGPIVLIVDFNSTTNAPDGFSRVVFGLAEAALPA